MTNLKTLKDLKHFGTFAEKGNEYIEIEELKSEAIKWVKIKSKRLGINEWISFFNLTEEDLK